MSYYTDKEIFYINSYNRINGDNSDFTYQLNIDNNIAWDRVVLIDASIPKSYYNVQDGQNTFTLIDDNGTHTITITPSNYTRTSLCTVLSSLLTNGGITYTITYQNIMEQGDNGKLIFTCSGNSTQPQFTFDNYLYEQLGFEKNTTYTFSGNSLTSPNICNLSPEGTLFITSNIVQNKSDSILGNIITPIDSSYSYVVYYNSAILEKSKKYSGSGSNVYWFKLVNENGDKINLNGLNMVFTIMIYKSNNIDNLIKGYIKLKTLLQN